MRPGPRVLIHSCYCHPGRNTTAPPPCVEPYSPRRSVNDKATQTRLRDAAAWLIQGMYDDAGQAQSHAFGISRRGPVSDTTMWHAGQASDDLRQRMRAFAANGRPASEDAPEDVDASKPVVGKAEKNLKFVHGCTLQTIGRVNAPPGPALVL